MKLTLDTYIISDTHWGHKNIIKYCDRPENHDELMVHNWINTVGERDVVLHLGDLAFKTKNYINFAALPGEKHLIKGNHDHKSNDWYNENGFEIAPRRIFFNDGGETILFTHYPEDNFNIEWDINIHGHIHNNYYRVKEEKARKFVNVSVEVMNYAPVKLRDILKEVYNNYNDE
jgi:calcineurin-like phosphoesterase family protein